jgi:hypothetical protein
MALWEAVENPDSAADLTSVLCLVGSVFALLSRYAVNFWNQGLHQGGFGVDPWTCGAVPVAKRAGQAGAGCAGKEDGPQWLG